MGTDWHREARDERGRPQRALPLRERQESQTLLRGAPGTFGHRARQSLPRDLRPRGRASSSFMRMSLLHALSVLVGATRTPSGLLVVAR
jgi:hypothetical protein